ncbi:MAG: hypothetical protein HS126_02375 [Anaerolineales bacterium]|nr:hypothetical protein [Anaerolineales bacterium]
MIASWPVNWSGLPVRLLKAARRGDGRIHLNILFFQLMLDQVRRHLDPGVTVMGIEARIKLEPASPVSWVKRSRVVKTSGRAARRVRDARHCRGRRSAQPDRPCYQSPTEPDRPLQAHGHAAPHQLAPGPVAAIYFDLPEVWAS